MTFPAAYDEATDHTTGPTPGAQALMAWALANYPPGTNLGIWVPRAQRGSTAPSVHWCGRAIDVGYPGRPGIGHPAGWALARTLVDHHADLGVQCVIHARQVWSTRQATWHPYTGTEPHWTHVHIELTHQAGQQLTAALITAAFQPPPTPATPTPEGDPMALYRLAQDRLSIDAAYDGFMPGGDPRGGGRDYWYRVVCHLRFVHRGEADGGDAAVEDAMASMLNALGAGAEPK